MALTRRQFLGKTTTAAGAVVGKRLAVQSLAKRTGKTLLKKGRKAVIKSATKLSKQRLSNRQKLLQVLGVK